MSSSNNGKKFLNEFKDFIDFIQNLWGILSGISIFFPLSNVLFKVIPIRSTQDDPSGGWSYLSPQLVTAVSTMVTLFVLVWTFGQRRNLRATKKFNFSRHAWISLILGFISLVLYLGIDTSIYVLFYDPLGITHGDPGRFVGDIFLLLFYVGFFALVTRAFILLGMREYFGLG
jgi:hypothetical protein